MREFTNRGEADHRRLAHFSAAQLIMPQAQQRLRQLRGVEIAARRAARVVALAPIALAWVGVRPPALVSAFGRAPADLGALAEKVGKQL
jgi:hypothetical protein